MIKTGTFRADLDEEAMKESGRVEAIKPKCVAVVVAGAGARGGYEAGVLSVLLPRLESAGVVPKIFVGTSAGAINAALFAAVAHLPAVEQGPLVLDVWRHIHTRDVFRSPLWSGWSTAGRWAGQIMRLPGVRVTSLLDTSPLQVLANQAADWSQLRTNVDSGRIALAVVTTSGADNRTVVFVDRPGETQPAPDDDRAIDYRAAQIGPIHVLASAAIPTIFPPVWVPDPPGQCLGPETGRHTGTGVPTTRSSGGWYLDGGVRLNAPVKPALSLGADAVVIVATHPAVDRASDAAHSDPREAPDVDDTLVRVMDAALVDRMVEDVRTLAKINALVRSAGVPKTAAGDARRHTVVPFLAVGPTDRGTLGLLATEVYGRKASALETTRRLLRDPTMRLLGRILAGDGSRRGDLLSYLFFDPEFMSASIALGQADATAAFAGSPAGSIPWQIGPNERKQSP